MVGRGKRHITMPLSPEWISVTIVDVTKYAGNGPPRTVKLRVGRVRLPNGGGTRTAAQVQGPDRDLFLLPPRSIARIMRVLWEGLSPL
jgi:hypothetical protein